MRWALGAALLASGCMLRSALVVEDRESVRVLRAVAYYDGPDADQQKHRLNLFVPGTAGPHPVIVFVHGGGWVFGDREIAFDAYGRLGRRLASRGWLTAIVSYRLAPAHKHPAASLDVARALAWVRAHAAEHGGDERRLFAVGHLAGAHLVTLVALDEGIRREAGLGDDALAGVVGISGPYDVRRLGASLFVGGPIVHAAFGPDPKVWREASPLFRARHARLPFLLAAADGDYPMLREDALAMAEALRSAGAPVDHIEVPLRDHFSVVTELGTEGDPLVERIAAFIADPKRRAEPKLAARGFDRYPAWP